MMMKSREKKREMNEMTRWKYIALVNDDDDDGTIKNERETNGRDHDRSKKKLWEKKDLRVDRRVSAVHRTATSRRPTVCVLNSFGVNHIWLLRISRDVLWPLHLFQWNSHADLFDSVIVRNRSMIPGRTASCRRFDFSSSLSVFGW